MDLTHDAVLVCLLWLGIGVSTSAVFKLGFYRFRLHHFLLQERLTQLASVDSLTGFQNRQGFFDGVADQVRQTGYPGHNAALMIMGVDHMTSINERYGHATGDQILCNVAKAVAQCGSAGLTGRLDGKKFGIFIANASFDDVVKIANDLRGEIALITRPDGFVTCSIGITPYLPNDTVMSLVDRADEAHLRAKRMGRDRVVIGEQRNDLPAQRVEQWPIADRSAMIPPQEWGDNVLLSHFQPLFSLSHHKAVGFEALLRGKSKAGEIIAPRTLFEHAPDLSGETLDRLSHRVHISTANSRLPADAWLFLNILPSTFTDLEYVEELSGLVNRAGLKPSNIVLEILESQDGDIGALADAASRCRAAGFVIAIDDFGAGHSNIDRLLRIQPDLVKLDGTLIRAKCRTTFRPLLPNLVSLLHSAGMLVVVEGVETNEDLVLAVDANVDLVQGYLLGRPNEYIDQSEISTRRVERAFEVASETREAQRNAFELKVQPYLDAMQKASLLFASGFEGPVDTHLNELELCSGCYLLDHAGRPFEHEAISRNTGEVEPRFPPLSNTHEVRWDNRPYFMRALASPGIPIYSEPFLSLTSGRATVVIACAIRHHGQRLVLTAKLDWTSPQLPWPNAGTI